MVEIHIVDPIGGTRWFDAVKQFYGMVAYYQQLEENDLVVIATIDDCIVGLCRLCKENDATVIRGLQVHPHYRGQGIGTQLLKAVNEVLGKHECFCLPFSYLEKLYNKVGFVRVDEQEVPSWFYDRYCHYRRQNLDVIVMKKGDDSSTCC